MKILFISNYSLLYGANRSMLTILQSLKAKGYDILVYLPSNGPYADELKKNGIDYEVIRFFPSYFYLKFLLKHLLVPVLFFYNFLVLPKLIKRTKKFNPDLICSNTSAENMGVILAKILKIKHISHIREFMSLDHGAYFIFGRRAKKSFINLSDGVIFVSQAVADYVLMGEALKDKHEVIYNGIESKSTSVPVKPLGQKVRLGSVGVLQSSKGHHLVIDYFNDYVKVNPLAELHIFGEGYAHYENGLKEKIRAYGLEDKVFLRGFVKNMLDIYSQIDVLCMFSRSEGFGRVTLEAMLNGVPVVGLRQGGTTELIDHERTGFLVTNYKEFEDSLVALFSSTAYYNTIAKNAFEVATTKFSVKKYVDNVERFILKVINNGK